MTTPVTSQVPHLDRAVLVARDELALVRVQREVVDGREVSVISLRRGRSAEVEEVSGHEHLGLRGREAKAVGEADLATDRTSQILTVPSSLPLTSHFASFCHAKLVTFAV